MRLRSGLAAAFLIVTGALLVPWGHAEADFGSECAAPTRTIAGDSTETISLSSTDVLLFASGTFTGGFNNLPQGSKVCVAAAATVNPAFLNNGAARFLVQGSVTFPSVVAAPGAELENAGTVNFPSGVNNNGPAFVHNLPGAVITVGVDIVLGSGAQIVNQGTITVTGSVTLNGGSSVDNSGTITVGGGMIVNGQVLNNHTLQVAGQVTLNGSALVRNICRMSAAGMMNNGQVQNAGVLDLDGGNLNNNGQLFQDPPGILLGNGLNDDGTVTGYGMYRFTGFTSVQGTFSGDSASAPIVVNDTTPTPGQIFDVQTGTVTNTVAGAVAIPPSNYSPPGCDIIPATSTDILATKMGPAAVAANGTITYTLTLTNNGPADAANVVLTDTLPAALTAVTSSPPGSLSGTTLTWNLGTVAANTSQTFTVTGTAPASGTLLDVASATTSTNDADPSNNNGSLPAARVTTIILPPPPNNPPVVQDATTTTLVNQSAVVDIVMTDPDAGQEVRITATSNPANGTVFFNPGGVVTFVPDPGFTGIDTFTVTGCDNGTPVLCDTGTVTVTVFPVALPDSAFTDSNTPVTIPVLRNDRGVTSAPQVISPPANGIVAVQPDGSVLYTPNSGFVGIDTFGYRICSPTVPDVCAQTTVTVLVSEPPTPPVLDDVDLSTEVDVPVDGAVPVSGPDPSTVVVEVLAPPSNGTVTIAPDGSFVYTPNNGFTGSDSFTVIGCDTNNLCDTAIVTITVTGSVVTPTPTPTPTSASGGGNLPGTSSPHTIRWLGLGAGLILTGAAMLGVALRRGR